MKFSHPDELLDHIGDEIIVSDWMTIEQSRIDGFAEVSGDHQWIHVDVARAATEMPDGKTIAHGFLLLSLFSGLSDQEFHVDNVSNTLNYGLERLRFTAMVPVGSRVRLRQTIATAEKGQDGSIRLAFDGTMDLEGSDKPAVVAQTIRLIFPK